MGTERHRTGNARGVSSEKYSKNLIEYLEDLEDAHDLLKAQREAVDFIPYDTFRRKLFAGKKS